MQSISWYYFTKRQWRYERRLVTQRTTEESYIHFIFRYLTTKSKIHVKVTCIYRKIKNQKNWLNDKNFTASFQKLFENPLYMCFYVCANPYNLTMYQHLYMSILMKIIFLKCYLRSQRNRRPKLLDKSGIMKTYVT